MHEYKTARTIFGFMEFLSWAVVVIGVIAAFALANAGGSRFGGMMSGGAAFGALWALIPAYLQARRGSHIVITTIMFNFIASALMVYLLVNVLVATGSMSPDMARTAGLMACAGVGDIEPRFVGRKREAVAASNTPLSSNAENASAARTSAHL